MDLKRIVNDYRTHALADSLQAVLEHQRTEDAQEDEAQLGRLMRAHEQAAASLRKYFERRNRLDEEARMRPLAFGGVRP